MLRDDIVETLRSIVHEPGVTRQIVCCGECKLSLTSSYDVEDMWINHMMLQHPTLVAAVISYLTNSKPVGLYG
jgi:hypothetical protein